MVAAGPMSIPDPGKGHGGERVRRARGGAPAAALGLRAVSAAECRRGRPLISGDGNSRRPSDGMGADRGRAGAAGHFRAGLRDGALRGCAAAFAALRNVIKDLGASARTAIHSPPATVDDNALPLLVTDPTARSNPVVPVLDDNRLRDFGIELTSVNRNGQDTDAS